MKIETFGQAGGKDIRKFTLSNSSGMQVQVLELGAILASVHAADREGTFADVLLGHDSLEEWLKDPHYFGAACGRVANRISGACFELDGKSYKLAANNDPHGVASALHGGIKGFSRKIWNGQPFERDGAEGVTLHLDSPDGDEGYPGALSIELTYTLTEHDEVVMNIKATTDTPTLVNIINHSYWNLSGVAGSSILSHTLEIPSSFYLPSGPGMIPTGERAPVEDSPFDFRKATAISCSISESHKCLELGAGFDHCYPLEQGDDLTRGALLHDPSSGRTLEILTDQPGIHLYTGNYLDVEGTGKNGASYPKNSGVALECGNYPNAINTPGFPSPILRPGETYRHKVVHKFSVN